MTITKRKKPVNWGLMVMMLPGSLALFAFSILPMFGIFIAFKNIDYEKGIFGSDWAGFDNFQFFMTTPDAWTITFNTIAYNVVFIIIGTACALAVALGLEGLRARKATRFYQAVMFLPYFLSWVVISNLVFALLSVDQGVLNLQVMKPLGQPEIMWYQRPELWPFILTFANLWKYVGYTSVIYLAAMMSIDPGFIEAASLEGATRLQIVRRIILPLIANVVVIMVLLQVGRIFFSDFGLFYNVTLNMGSLFPTTQTIDTYVYRTLMNMGDIGMSSAAGLYQSVVGCVVVILANVVVKRIDPDKSLF
ncbi:MAG: ABC transporter permease subunit [Spirochaetales bacterium]